MSEQARTARIVVPLPLDGDGPRFAPDSLKAMGVNCVELCPAPTPLSEKGREELQARLHEAHLTAAFVTSNPEGWALDTLRQTFELGDALEVEGVVTNAPPRDIDEQQAVGWLEKAVAIAKANGIPLLIENRPGTWADSSRSCLRYIDRADPAWLGAAFDPAGFVALREHPFLLAFMSGHLKARSRLIRARDAVFGDGRLVRINAGNAEIAELVSAALARGFDGFFGVGGSAAELEDVQLELGDFRELLDALGLEGFVS